MTGSASARLREACRFSATRLGMVSRVHPPSAASAARLGSAVQAMGTTARRQPNVCMCWCQGRKETMQAVTVAAASCRSQAVPAAVLQVHVGLWLQGVFVQPGHGAHLLMNDDHL